VKLWAQSSRNWRISEGPLTCWVPKPSALSRFKMSSTCAHSPERARSKARSSVVGRKAISFTMAAGLDQRTSNRRCSLGRRLAWPGRRRTPARKRPPAFTEGPPTHAGDTWGVSPRACSIAADHFGSGGPRFLDAGAPLDHARRLLAPVQAVRWWRRRGLRQGARRLAGRMRTKQKHPAR